MVHIIVLVHLVLLTVDIGSCCLLLVNSYCYDNVGCGSFGGLEISNYEISFTY